MPREYVVRLRHNATDDRWTYTIDDIRPSDMMFPRSIGGVDDMGYDQYGPWNAHTSGFLREIVDCVADEIDNVFENSDSFEYA